MERKTKDELTDCLKGKRKWLLSIACISYWFCSGFGGGVAFRRPRKQQSREVAKSEEKEIKKEALVIT